MAIDTIHVRTKTSAQDRSSPGIVDVSDLPAKRIRTLAGDARSDDVYFERRGGKTFLITAH